MILRAVIDPQISDNRPQRAQNRLIVHRLTGATLKMTASWERAGFERDFVALIDF
jgi:hypothetical protein